MHDVTNAALCSLRKLALGVIVGALLSSFAAAQTPAGYPNKPVRIVVPYGPGGIADVTMRMVADDLSKRFGQQFHIDNRPGAAGIVGMQAALQATADGYTMVMIGGGLTIAKALFKHLPYDIEKDITPVSTTASYPLLIVTKADSPPFNRSAISSPRPRPILARSISGRSMPGARRTCRRSSFAFEQELT
jgi:tripartite-type tricarboxylate transporter receptor subunit TctC